MQSNASLKMLNPGYIKTLFTVVEYGCYAIYCALGAREGIEQTSQE